MATLIKCDCDERVGIEINSLKLFEELMSFFKSQIVRGIFQDIEVKKPYYIGYDNTNKKYEWYADKWYKCMCCGTLWEFRYPDFPAKGFVKKFPNGKYIVKGIK